MRKRQHVSRPQTATVTRRTVNKLLIQTPTSRRCCSPSIVIRLHEYSPRSVNCYIFPLLTCFLFCFFFLVPGSKFFVEVAGTTKGAHKKIVSDFERWGYVQVSPEQSDFVLIFCPVVSRVGTDITAALQNVSECMERHQFLWLYLKKRSAPEFVETHCEVV